MKSTIHSLKGRQSGRQGERLSSSGFMLLETMMAFMIFSIAVVGILLAVNKTAELSHLVRREQWAAQQAQNLLLEVTTLEMVGEEYEREEYRPLDDGAEARIFVELYEGVLNQDEEELNELYRITVTVRWDEGGGNWGEVENSIVHYRPLFSQQPRRGQVNRQPTRFENNQ